MITRYSSRTQSIDDGLLRTRLRGASSYDRIAGYFRSSLLEVAGEELESITGPIRIVCNSDIHSDDVKTAIAAQRALRSSWCTGRPEELPDSARPRFERLFDLLTERLPTGELKLQVKVVPDDVFGLIHGKAGLIRYPDRDDLTFMGSVNESLTAWRLNYELVWEDDSPEAAKWFIAEFEALWHHKAAVDLACCPFIESDIGRLAKRRKIPLADWKSNPDPASVAVESPIYRNEHGLWPHQKYFVRLAMERHKQGGARLLLADQVGLGKTVQLAMAALLMGLEDDGPILVLAPKPLLKQWQGELKKLLHIPTARWTGKAWVDENDVKHPSTGPKGLRKCPRRIGLVSQGLITRGNPEVISALLAQQFVCVIVDESHRARRADIPKTDDGPERLNVQDKVKPNKLMSFLLEVGKRTKSMLLATATPVQLHPIEAWDLLTVLSAGHEGVLGNPWSKWRTASECLRIAMGEDGLPSEPHAAWAYACNPLPAGTEDPTAKKVRDRLNLASDKWVLMPEAYDDLPRVLQNTRLIPTFFPEFAETHNPLLRNIVRRTRTYLQETINPITREPWLARVDVQLFGEDDDGALHLTPYLEDAYDEAEEFTKALAQRVKGAGFFKTLLMRRLGSSLEAGQNTISKLLGIEHDDDLDEDDVDEEVETPNQPAAPVSEFRNFSDKEREALVRCLRLLEECRDPDPKLEAVLKYLLRGARHPDTHQETGPWLERGCILFSQYFDTAYWVGTQLALNCALKHYDIGLYAGGSRSGIWKNGVFERCDREKLKDWVTDGSLRVLLGTDAASEGLNLQKLGTLINIDLPWNPTRLEQRKGRIQRIGQRYPEVWVANLRYRGSVEDRVHQLLSQRLADIHTLFGQIPDTLEDVWVHLAQGEREAANLLIDSTVALTKNPFDRKYSRVEDVDWESTKDVLDPVEMAEAMQKGWSS